MLPMAKNKKWLIATNTDEKFVFVAKKYIYISIAILSVFM
jgi:hypothetical protein